MSRILMEVIQKKDKEIYKIPLDFTDVLEGHRVELPSHIIMETCDSPVCNHETKPCEDGEVVILNFLDGGIILTGTIRGYKNGILTDTNVLIKPKENFSFYGWDYADELEIEVTITANLLTNQQIPFVDGLTIPMKSRCKHLIFYS